MKTNTLWITLILLLSLVGPAAPAQGQDVASDLLGRINGLRTSLGLAGYSLNGALSAAAQNHASWMAATGQISHTQPDGSTPSSRAAAAGYTSSAVSENIYMGSNATAASAWQWWLNSPIHYRGITNAAYTEVGIGSAAGEYGRSFVLVFGNPQGWQITPRRSSSTSGGGNNGGVESASGGLPSFVVGVDNVGNIMHEIQPGQTLGDIVFIYGYDWPDLQTFRDLNNLTEEQGRNLQIGAVLLVPPWEGTYTPTPGDPPTATPPAPGATQPAEVALLPTSTSEQPVLPIPTFTPTATASITPTIKPGATSAVVPEWVLMTANPDTDAALMASPTAIPTTPPLTQVVQVAQVTQNTVDTVGWTAATMTPTPLVVAEAVAGAGVEALPPQNTPVPAAVPDSESGSNTNTLLVIAIVLQVFILGAAGVEFWRRGKR